MERNSSEEVSQMKKYPLVLGLLALISLGTGDQLVQAAPQADYEVLAQYEREDRWFTQGLPRRRMQSGRLPTKRV